MMTSHRIIPGSLILLICICLTGCCHQNRTVDSIALKKKISAGSEAGLTQARKSGSESEYPVICRLKTRGKLITICTGPDSPLFTVKSGSGQVLAIDIPAPELVAEFPDLKDIIEHGIADWAGLDCRYQRVSGPGQAGGDMHPFF